MIKFDFTVDEINLILAGLHELPAKLSMQLIIKLQNEGQKQLSEQNEGQKQLSEQNKNESGKEK